MKTALGATLGLLLSANVSAGLVELSTDWWAGWESINGVQEYGTGLGGKISYFYEEGTNIFTSIVFYDQEGDALFSSITPTYMEFPHYLQAPSPKEARLWLGHEREDLPLPLFQNLQTGEFLSLYITEARLALPEAGLAPTLDHFNGNIWAALLSENYSMSFLGAGAAVKTPVSVSVPEPAALGLMFVGLAGLVVSRRRRAA